MFKTEIKLTLFLFCFLGIPQKTGTATLTINVADINDEYPRIKGVPYAKIMENQPAVTKVTTIFGQDPDSAENGPPFGFEAIPCTNNEPQCKFTVNFLSGKLIFFITELYAISASITTDVVSSNLDQGEVYNIM